MFKSCTCEVSDLGKTWSKEQWLRGTIQTACASSVQLVPVCSQPLGPPTNSQLLCLIYNIIAADLNLCHLFLGQCATLGGGQGRSICSSSATKQDINCW